MRYFAVVLACVFAAACGGGTEKAASVPTASVQAQPSEQPSASTSPIPRSKAAPSSKNATPVPTKAPKTQQKKAYNAFADCLRKHGVDLPAQAESWTPPPNADLAKVQRAYKACMAAKR